MIKYGSCWAARASHDTRVLRKRLTSEDRSPVTEKISYSNPVSRSQTASGEESYRPAADATCPTFDSAGAYVLRIKGPATTGSGQRQPTVYHHVTFRVSCQPEQA